MKPLRFLVLSLVLVPFAACAAGDEDLSVAERAREIHENVMTIDTHVDIPFTFASGDDNPCQLTDRQVDVPKMREGGLDVGFFIVYVGQTERTEENYEEAKELAMQKFDGIHRMVDELCPDEIELAYSPADAQRIYESGKLVAAIGIENGYVIGKDLSLLETYYDLGARYVTLAHIGHNDIADSSIPREDLGDGEAEHGGISEFGAEAIAEMNRLGILVDVSHISKDAMLDAVRLSRAPVIGSHSSVTALADHPRNMDDEQLDALAENDGVIQITAFDSYIKVQPEERGEAVTALREELGLTSREAMREMSDETRAEYERRMAEIEEEWPSSNVSDFVDHIDYAVDRIGIDHVGISSDFDGGGGIIGWNDASETFNVTHELVRRGYTEEEIAKLWYKNTIRLWEDAERVATEILLENGTASD